MKHIKIRILKLGDEDDLGKLLGLYTEVFGEPNQPNNTNYLGALLERDEVLFFAAYKSGALVGGLTAYLLPSIYGDYSELYIYDFAVSTTHQRQGMGSQLLDFLKEYSKKINVRNIFVQADAEDTHARDFYKKNGGIEEDVRHFDFKVT